MADDSQRKLAGTLYLNLTELQADVERANDLLNDIGKRASFDGLTKNLSTQLKKAVQDATQGVDLSKIGSSSKQTSKSVSEKEVTSLLRQQMSYMNSMAQIDKQLVSAKGLQKEQLQASRSIYQNLLADVRNQTESAKSQVTSEESLTRIATQEQVIKAKILTQQAGITKATEQAEAAQKKQTIAAQAMQKVSSAIVTSFTQMAVQMTVGAVKQFWSDAWEYSTKYYDQLNEIRIVTGKTQQEANELGKSFRNMAVDMGVSSTDLASGAITYYRQGLNDDEVQSRLVATTQYAKTTGMAFDQAADMITASVNTIAKDANGMEMTAQRVADVFLYLGDNAATSGRFCPIVR